MQHAEARRQGIERRGGVDPRRRRLLVAFQRRVDETVVDEDWEVAQGDHDDDAGQHRPAPDDDTAEGVDERGGPEGEADHEQRQGAGARAQRQRQTCLAVAAEQPGDRRRVAEGMDTHGQHEAGERQGDRRSDAPGS